MIKFSKHALEQIAHRHIAIEIVQSVIDRPDSMDQSELSNVIYQKKVKFENEDFLVRVFVNQITEPHLVITAYKTSKLNKYK